MSDARRRGKKKFDAPVPLSEFAKRQKSSVNHSGNGRRDQLSAGERTRILRMLRDEGGRMADEDSQVFIGAAPPSPNDPFDFDDSPAPAPVSNKTGASGMSPTPVRVDRGDIPAKPAVVVGLAQAKARSKRSSERPAVGGGPRPARRSVPPPVDGEDVIASASASARRLPLQPDGNGSPGRRSPLPPPFTEEATRQVDESMLAQLRGAEAAGAPLTLGRPPNEARPGVRPGAAPVTLAPVDLDESSRPGDAARAGAGAAPLRRHAQRPRSRDRAAAFGSRGARTIEDHSDEATRMASLDNIAAQERANHASQQMPVARSEGSPPPRTAGSPGPRTATGAAPRPGRRNGRPGGRPPPRPPADASANEERTRAVDIRHDKSISDIDWDLD